MFILVLAVGAIGFTVSWDNLLKVAESALPGTLDTSYVSVKWAHALPAVIDGGILALTFMRLWNAIYGRRLPFATWFLNVLIAATIAINATSGDSKLSMLIHALPAAVYVAVSETFIHSISKRYKVVNDHKPKTSGITLSRWILAPFSTFVMWRVMTIAGSNELAVFVQIARMRIVQHKAWRDERGSGWWVPVLGVSKADRTELNMRLLELSVGTTEPQNQNQKQPGTGSLVSETSNLVPETVKPEPQNWAEPVPETVQPKPRNQVARKPRNQNRVVEGTATETGTAEPLDVDGMTKDEKDAAIMKTLDDLYDPDVTPSLSNMTEIAKHFHVGKARVVEINKRRLALIAAN